MASDILLILITAAISFAASYFFFRKQFRATKEASTLQYERGRRYEADRRQHEIDLLTKEIDSLNDIEHRKLLVETGRSLLRYFAEMKITTEFQAAFPLADASTFNTLLNKYGEQNERGHTKEMLEFVKLIKSYNTIHGNRAEVLLPLMQAGDAQAIKAWDDKLLAAAHEIGSFINGVITDVQIDE